MKSKTKGFWQTLEKIPGLTAVEADWKVRFGTDCKSGMKFLRPNGKLALSYPCMILGGCGCYHDVINHSADDIVAVCKCGRECEPFPLQHSDIAVYELNRLSLCNEIANAFNLLEETESYINHPNSMPIGIYSPVVEFRFPVFLTIQLEGDDFESAVKCLLSRIDKPFILMAPTRDLCSSQTEILLSSRKSAFVPLLENTTITKNRNIRLLRPLDDILSQFINVNYPPLKDDISRISSQSSSEAISSDKSNESFKISHFKYDIQDCPDPRGAARWAWKCLENLAAIFCEYYCDRSKCNMSEGIIEKVTKYRITDSAQEKQQQWQDGQSQLHEALAYLPELAMSIDTCPACAITKAFSAFPDIIKYSPQNPVATVRMNGEDCYPDIVFSGGYQRSSVPCVIIETSLPDFMTQTEEKLREISLLELNVSDLPAMPPDKLSEIKKKFSLGQIIVKGLYQLRNNAQSEEEIKDIDYKAHCNQAIVSAFALKDLGRILYFYPDAINKERAQTLYSELLQYLENALETEGLKPVRELYERPMYRDHSTESNLSIVSGLLLISHPEIDVGDGSPEIISQGCKEILQDCIRNSSGSLKDIANEIIYIKMHGCLVPRPSDDSLFAEKGRFVQMLEHYWSICKKIITYRLNSWGYAPANILPLMTNLKKRATICLDELKTLDGFSNANQALEVLFDTCTSPDVDELTAVPEWTQGETHKIDTFISNASLAVKRREYPLLEEERIFIDQSNRELDDFHAMLDSQWKKMLANEEAEGKKITPKSEAKQSSRSENGNGKFLIERKLVGEEVHWIVNGVSKGRFYQRPSAKKAKIIEALYDQIGKGWVPHRTFMNGCGWSEKEYYPAYNEPGCMQRQLTEIRKFLNVQIAFNKEKGVRFAENVVKSRE